jgi:polysaccharide export outer membrane protein
MKRIFPILACITLLPGLPAGSLFAQQTQTVAMTTAAASPSGPAPSAAAPAAGAPAADTASGDPQLKLSPEKVLENFEAPADAQYQLGAGDTIDLYVAGHPELTHAYTVGPDGRITLPISGQLSVLNLTREGAGKAITDAMSAYYTNPAVTVGVEKYGSNKIMIYGNVQHPGTLDYEGTQPTLLDAISRGGMVTNTSAKDGLPDQCMIYRATNGQTQTVNVNLREMLTGGSPMSDLRLRRGDVIFVPIQQQQFISVMGEVMHPGPVTYTAQLDLRMAMTQAGGLGEAAGGNPTIWIVQTSTGKKIQVKWNDLMQPGGASEVRLHPGDMIYVPKSGFYKFTYIFSKLSPIATMATLIALE